MYDQESAAEDSNTQETLKNLKLYVEKLVNSTGALMHRLDSIERMLDQKTFNYETLKVTFAQEPPQVRELAKILGLEETTTIGTFLRALNRHLMHQGLVDLNDLEIHMTPLLQSAFGIVESKVPYVRLFLGITRIFQNDVGK